MHVDVFVLEYVHVSAGTPKGQKMVLDFLKLELQAVISYSICVLKTELRSSVSCYFLFAVIKHQN